MTSLIISPLRLRKIHLALAGMSSSMFGSIMITKFLNFDPTIFNFNMITIERYMYFKNFPHPLVSNWLVDGYEFLCSDWVLNALLWGAIIGFIVSVLLIDKLVIDKSTSLIRGNTIANVQELKKMLKKEKSRLFIGREKIPLPYTSENRSIGIIGMAGSGKTQGIFSIFAQVVNFNETMIIYDRKPDFWITYFREGKDYLFYPADKRSIKWNFFLDIPDDDQEMIDEADKIVKSFIPETQSKEKFWDNTARMILKGIIIKIKTSPNPSTKKLIDFIRQNQTKEAIWAQLEEVNNKYGLRIKALLTEAAEATAGSIMMNLEPYFAKIMRSEFYTDEGDFSIKDFINSVAEHNIDQRLFLVQTKQEEGNYEGYFRVMLDMQTRTILSLKNNINRRIWIFLDEAQTLGKLNEINDQLAEGRSKGSCMVFSTQDLARIEELYGEHLMRNMFQLLSTKILLQYDDPKGQKFLSEFLGEQEVEEKNKNRMISRESSRDIEQVSERNATKKVLLTGELGLLKSLHAYLKIPGYPTVMISFKFFQPEIKHELIKSKQNDMFKNIPQLDTKTKDIQEKKPTPKKKPAQDVEYKNSQPIEQIEFTMDGDILTIEEEYPLTNEKKKKTKKPTETTQGISDFDNQQSYNHNKTLTAASMGGMA